MSLTKENKLITLGIKSINDIPDEYIELLYKMMLDKKEKEEIERKENAKKNSKKYKILLRLINKILLELGKAEIQDLRDFKDIDRDDIIKEDSVECYNELEDELFKYFDKNQCGWYRRKLTKNYILAFIRYACKDVGLSFTSRDQRYRDSGTQYHYVEYSIEA